ncbi:MAG: hypothetical protein HY986_10005 [Candidatus Melainabacteria bacterium]|nr:hypothetical protein [Candidatus Melainabacteria bacterium]
MGYHDETYISNHPPPEAGKLKSTAIFKVAKKTADNPDMSHSQAEKRAGPLDQPFFIAF